MGLFSSIGKLVSLSIANSDADKVLSKFDKTAINEMRKENEQMKLFKEECKYLSVDDLCEEINHHYKSSDFKKRQKATAAYVELKNRGYTIEELKLKGKIKPKNQ